MLSENQVRQKRLNEQARHYAVLFSLLGAVTIVFGLMREVSLPAVLGGLGVLVCGAVGYWLSRKTKRLEQSVKIDTPDWERTAIGLSEARWQRWLNRWAMIVTLLLLALFVWGAVDSIFGGEHMTIKRWIALAAGNVGCVWMLCSRLKHAFQTHIF